jgi:ubiquinol-cytochrome c reductase cytochrome b subunit
MATGESPAQQAGGLWGWLNARFPIDSTVRQHLTGYYVPKSVNGWYALGSLSLVVLVIEFVTGLFLAMDYKPSEAGAFASVEYIMREVKWGWLIRYLHSTGASALFIIVYLHMFRMLMYGSYRAPRELVWIIGLLIYLCMMVEAFFGYLLPWGNLSYWGAQVIVSLFGTIPFVGDALTDWIRGDFYVSDVTLTRFYALHAFAVPLLLLILAVAHMVALHTVGSSSPDGVEVKNHADENGPPPDGVPFHPYCTVDDLFALGVFLLLFCAVVFFAPTLGGLFLEAQNFEIANPMQTPPHIAPVWYLTPFYAILRAVPSFFGTPVWGVIAMFGAVLLPFLMPWLDRSPVNSIRYKGPIAKVALALFAISFCVLAYCGMNPPEGLYSLLGRIFTVIYFAYFLLMPWWSRIDRVKPVPTRVTYHAH